MSILLVLLGVIFFALLNLKFTLLSPDKAKVAAADSNFYSIAATYIKSEIVKSSDLSLNEGENFNQINLAVTATTVKSTVDRAIDDIFVVMADKKASRVIPVNFSSTSDGGMTFSLSKKINLNNNKIFAALQKINLILILDLLLFIATFYVLLDTVDQVQKKLKRSARLLFATAAILLVAWETVANYLSGKALDIVTKSNFFVETKLVNGISKIFQGIIAKESMFFWSEIIVLLIIASILHTISKSEQKENLGKIDLKI